jgi:hypothetical protein
VLVRLKGVTSDRPSLASQVGASIHALACGETRIQSATLCERGGWNTRGPVPSAGSTSLQADRARELELSALRGGGQLSHVSRVGNMPRFGPGQIGNASAMARMLGVGITRFNRSPAAEQSCASSGSVRSRPARIPIMTRSTIFAGCGSLPGGMTASMIRTRPSEASASRQRRSSATQVSSSQSCSTR